MRWKCSISSKNNDLTMHCATPHSIYMDNAEEYWIATWGVTRLDGTLGKKQAWHPMFEPEVFRKQMCCIEVLVTLLGLFGVPRIILRQGNCASCLRVVTPLITASSDNKPWCSALTRVRREQKRFGGEAKILICPNFAPPWGKRIEKFCRATILHKQLAKTYRGVFPEIF